LSLDLVFFALAIPAVLFAGISKGGFGNGAAFAATPILAQILDPALALAVMLPLLMMMDVAAVPAYWRKWHGPAVRAMLIGAVPGIVIAGAVYEFTDPDVFRLLIGLMALAFVGWQGARRAGWLTLPKAEFQGWKGSIAGMASGFTSFISHAGGPPAAMFLLPLGLDRTTYQATTVLFFWAVNLIKLLPYILLGFFTAQTLLANLLLAPVAFLGVYIGVRAHKVMSEGLYFGITYVVLTISGVRLIWMALT
jgi:uncharacterized membrane protein YfcA